MAVKTAKYVVVNGDIWAESGRYNVGEVAELTATEAKRFSKLKLLAPYIDEEDEDPSEAGNTA